MSRIGPTPPPPDGRAQRRSLLPALNLLAVLLISVLDGMTPAGVVVGILASLPIVAASFTDSPRQVWLTFGAAVSGFVLAAIFGQAPLSPAAVWVPNRLLAFFSLPASCAFSLLLQKRRLEATRARDAALASSELSRLLGALLAHDLRAPLLLASQGLSYVRDSLASGQRPDAGILAELEARLQRSLREIDAVLAMARPELASSRAARGG
ncbi:MAG TPA: hypothetical protein VGR37_10340, partial [Longimicrobiaceae bacterium]|nr:hypothetical protein [Longimicrobiaceae bacterium]